MLYAVLIFVHVHSQRAIISQYQKLGYDFIFAEQVVGFTQEGRKSAWSKLQNAITRALQASHRAVPKPKKQTTKKTKYSTTQLHDHQSSKHCEDIDTLFRQSILAQYDEPKAAFKRFEGKDGTLGRKGFKKLTSSLGIEVSEDERKRLRKRIDTKKAIDLVSFLDFVGGNAAGTKGSDTGASANGTSDGSHSKLARLPVEVPELPPAFRERGHAQQQLMQALLDSTRSSTAVTAPKSRVSSQGMGGVGKTLLTAAVVREERIRAAFKLIGWVNLSQQPDLLRLQQR
jgi:hypothetical protein